MKNRIIKTIVALFITSFMFHFLSAQDGLNETYDWNKESDEITVYVDVNSNTKALSMSFNGQVSEGNLIVSAYDPNGNKQSGFCLITNCELSCGKNDKNSTGKGVSKKNKGKNKTYSVSTNTNNGTTQSTMSSSGEGYSYSCSSDENDSGAKGNSIETITDPTSGKWKFVIEAVEVTGQLTANVHQN